MQYNSWATAIFAQRSFLLDCKTIEFAATMKLFELLFFVPSAKSLLLQVPIKRRNSKIKFSERERETLIRSS